MGLFDVSRELIALGYAGGEVMRLLQTVQSLLDVPLRYIFGRDIFISYSRRDADTYAPRLAVALQSRRPKLSFYLDRWIAPPEGTLPRSLVRQLRWSSMLVLICTRNSVNSSFVKAELVEFSKMARKVIPIDVEHSFFELAKDEPLWRHIGGASPETERLEALSAGEPSDTVLERILKSVEFTEQDARLRRMLWGTLGLTVSMIALTAFYSAFTVKAAQNEAQRQREIGSIRSMGNQSSFMLRQRPDSLVDSAALAVQAAARADALGMQLLEAGTALRDNVALLPSLHGLLTVHGHVGKDNVMGWSAAFSRIPRM